MQNRDEILIKAQELGLSEQEAEKFVAMQKAQADMVADQIRREIESLKDEHDVEVLAQRGEHGLRVLTSQEKSFYDNLAKSSSLGNINAALQELDVVLPETVFNKIFEDLVGAHPLLGAIKFQNINALVEMYVNTNASQLATWDALNTGITKELTSSFKKITFGQNKLSAWIPVHQDMLTLGPNWLDRYVRQILADSIACGLEDAIINGDGKNKPIGMVRDIEASVTNGQYTAKTAKAVTTLDPKTYGELIATIAKTPNGHYKAVSSVTLIVNPVDKYKTIDPVTTQKLTGGGYAYNQFPFPTNVIVSEQMEEGKAVIGDVSRYFMGVGAGRSGAIEYSDQYQFLEDNRVFKTKLYGHGEPLDNNAFIVLDITGLTADVPTVKTKS